MNKFKFCFAALILLASASFTNAQNSAQESAEVYFSKAITNLFSNEPDNALVLFDLARDEFKLAGKHRKMIECLMAKAMIEFSRQNFEKSLTLFKKSREEHLQWCKDDLDGLKAIDESIALFDTGSSNN